MDLKRDREEYHDMIQYFNDTMIFDESKIEHVNENVRHCKKKIPCVSCGRCNHRRIKHVFCDLSTKIMCTACEHEKQPYREINCLVCKSSVICKCTNLTFLRLTSQTHCCRCVDIFPTFLIRTYRLRKPPPTVRDQCVNLALKTDVTTVAAKMYNCLHCKRDFIVKETDKSLYWSLQRWYCSRVSCQEKCATFYKQEVHDSDKLE